MQKACMDESALLHIPEAQARQFNGNDNSSGSISNLSFQFKKIFVIIAQVKQK